MKIELGKKYRTKDGYSARILCVDRISELFPVIALVITEDGSESIESYTIDGHFYETSDSNCSDLVEVGPWDDYVQDERVYVRHYDYNPWKKRHFARVQDGKPATWNDGHTSWTAGGEDDIITWTYCSRTGGE